MPHPDPAASLAEAIGGSQSVLITGGTGFVGTRLVEALVAGGHKVTVLTRNRASAAKLLAPVTVITDLAEIDSAAQIDAVVNLAGESLTNGLWTKAKRERIIASRVQATRGCVDLIARLERKPAVLVNSSAIGWYGLRGDEVLDESGDAHDGFLHQICRDWEAATAGAGVRTVLMRIGLVLDSSGGMLAPMLTPFKFGLGGRFGNGKHWMSWIHRDDLVRLIVHAIATPALAGPLNATAPEPVTNRDFTRALGAALHRPAILPVPRWPLHLLLGQLADDLLFSGQRVLPKAAQSSGFVFRYPQLDGALQAILKP